MVKMAFITKNLSVIWNMLLVEGGDNFRRDDSFQEGNSEETPQDSYPTVLPGGGEISGPVLKEDLEGSSEAHTITMQPWSLTRGFKERFKQRDLSSEQH